MRENVLTEVVTNLVYTKYKGSLIERSTHHVVEETHGSHTSTQYRHSSLAIAFYVFQGLIDV